MIKQSGEDLSGYTHTNLQVDHVNGSLYMKEKKKTLSHHGHTKLCACISDAWFRDLQIWGLKLKFVENYFSPKLRYFRGSCFSQCFIPSSCDNRTLLPTATRRVTLSQLRPVWFVFERARAPRQFLLGKRAPYKEIVNFHWNISRAPLPRQWPGGREATAFVASVKYHSWQLHSSLLYNKSISPHYCNQERFSELW